MDIKSKIESILFVTGDEVSIKKIKRTIGDITEDEILREVEALKRDYQERGVRIIVKDNNVQMVSAPENAEMISTLVKSQLAEDLTPATLETLACIAYREPISKPEIDELRGVNSIFSIRNLLMRGLIEKVKTEGNKGDVKMDAYRVTLDFLKKLGIEQVSDLPQYDELSKTT